MAVKKISKVQPEKIKLAIGLFGFLRPTLALLIALETALTASSWPISPLFTRQ